ncbi:unnamed protein product [Psylliodes chrysocephalus]|uniref:Uncharacterized protein n=1 Tax=Psylliodes chrysocephalus TaxID=3402493 RepID=A0A9P0G9X7_9CUCU|nr:unnamed protein product [Psylliodes chrysocephala]
MCRVSLFYQLSFSPSTSGPISLFSGANSNCVFSIHVTILSSALFACLLDPWRLQMLQTRLGHLQSRLSHKPIISHPSDSSTFKNPSLVMFLGVGPSTDPCGTPVEMSSFSSHMASILSLR